MLSADINASGGVNLLDAMAVINAVAGYDGGYTAEQLDVNRDTAVNLQDTWAVIDQIASFDAEGEEHNSPPVATDDFYSVKHDMPLSDSVAYNDWDIDSDPLTFSLTSGTSSGELIFESGAFTYTPNALFVGGDSFTYSVSDGQYTMSGVAHILIPSQSFCKSV